MLFGKVSCCTDWTRRIIPTKAYAYLDKTKSLGLLDKNFQNQNNDDFFSKDFFSNKTQSFKMWPKPWVPKSLHFY